MSRTFEQVAELRTQEYTLAPSLNFPFFVEREWFAGELAGMTALVYEQTSDGLRQCGPRRREPGTGKMIEERPMPFQADGILAALPLVIGNGTFVVKYLRPSRAAGAHGREKEVVKTAVARAERDASASGQSRVTLEMTY